MIKYVMGVIEKSPGAQTVPGNHTNKNKTAKTKENMQISAIKSMENTWEHAIHIA